MEDLTLKGEQSESQEIYYRSDAYYDYYLVGVVVHVGSADSGHYYSYINTVRNGHDNVADYDESDKKMESCWLEYNDSNISKFNLETLESECFGGAQQHESTGYFWGASSENCKNAYLLVYERKIKMPQKVLISSDKVDKQIKLGKSVIEIKDEKQMIETNYQNDLNDSNKNSHFKVFKDSFYNC